ncbi:hypothetical protein CF319_g828 [Tilletia indica]|nr:hypothetical protein CF319_g828 [Tilletia indica]
MRVRIFLPEDLLSSQEYDRLLLRPRSNSSSSPSRTLLGWVHSEEDNRSLIVVVAGAVENAVGSEEIGVCRNRRVPPLQDVGSLRLPSASDQEGRESFPSSTVRSDKGKSRAREGDNKTSLQMVLGIDAAEHTRSQIRLWSRLRSKQRRTIQLTQLRLKGQDLLADRDPTPIQIFHYRPPRPDSLQYLSLHPVAPPPPGAPALNLLTPNHQPSSASSQNPSSTLPSVAVMLQRALEASVDADPVRQVELRQPKGAKAHLRLAIDLMNEAAASLQDYHHRLADGDTDTARPSAVTQFQQQIWDRAFRPIYETTLSSLFHTIILLRRLLVSPFPFQSHRRRPPLSLVDIFATAHQLNTRFGQLLLWPVISRNLRTLRIEGTLPTRSISPSYMSVWNGIWLVANDLILGRAVGTFLRLNRVAIAAWLSTSLQKHTVRDLMRMLDWLGHWPAGLKLNTELARFFGDMYSGTTQLWNEVVLQPSPGGSTGSLGLGLGMPDTLSTLVDFIGLCGQWGGLTLILALCADALVLWTIHIHIIYLVSRSIYAWLLYTIDILFQVFRGKKRNALRGGRVDDAEYELDQRLLGTILFTLLAFLFPTVLVYYLPFALAEWMRVGVRAGVLEVGLALLNHLPLFGLMLRLKDPARVPAGIQLEPEDGGSAKASSSMGTKEGEASDQEGTGAGSRCEHQVYRVRSVPAGVHQIFHGYGVHLGQARQMPGLLLNVLTGRHIEVASAGIPDEHEHG